MNAVALSDTFNHVYEDINNLIRQKKYDVKNAVNEAMISLYWGIGKKLTEEITGVNKPEYGKKVVLEISNRLSEDYGAGFNKSAISRMINFYQEFHTCSAVLDKNAAKRSIGKKVDAGYCECEETVGTKVRRNKVGSGSWRTVNIQTIHG